MVIMRNYILALQIILISINPMKAFASGYTYEQFIGHYKVRDARMMLDQYLLGLGRGLQLGNVIQEMEGGKKMYCPPKNIVMQVEQYKSVIDEYRKTKFYREELMEITLLRALKHAFPC